MGILGLLKLLDLLLRQILSRDHQRVGTTLAILNQEGLRRDVLADTNRKGALRPIIKPRSHEASPQPTAFSSKNIITF